MDVQSISRLRRPAKHRLQSARCYTFTHTERTPVVNKEFLERVQLHERTWGSEQYPARPQLADILGAKVVAFWLLTPKKSGAEPRHAISLHDDLKDIENWYLQAVTRLHLQLPDRRLVAAYLNQQKVRVKSVKIVFDIPDTDK
jgi:hypothetical protein